MNNIISNKGIQIPDTHLRHQKALKEFLTVQAPLLHREEKEKINKWISKHNSQ